MSLNSNNWCNKYSAGSTPEQRDFVYKKFVDDGTNGSPLHCSCTAAVTYPLHLPSVLLGGVKLR